MDEDVMILIIFGVVFAVVFISVLIGFIVKTVKRNKRNNRNSVRRPDQGYYNGSGYGHTSHDFFDTPPAPRRKRIDPFGYDTPAQNEKYPEETHDAEASASDGKKCPTCGSPREETDKFCPYCGHKFK